MKKGFFFSLFSISLFFTAGASTSAEPVGGVGGSNERIVGQSQCQQQYDGCTTPNGKPGYCWPDDLSTDGYACLPSDGIGSGGSVGGGGSGGCIVASNNTDGNCQAAGASCAGTVGTPKAGSSCGVGEVCCSRVIVSGGGPGGGGPVGGGGGSAAGLACRGYFCWPSQSGLSQLSISSIIVRVMNWLLIILGSIAIIAFVISGIQYLTAAGNDERMEAGKKNMQYSIIGVIIALSGLVIVFAIDRALFGTQLF